MKKEDDEMNPQVPTPTTDEEQQEREAKLALLRAAGGVDTRHVIDSQAICKEVRGNA